MRIIMDVIVTDIRMHYVRTLRALGYDIVVVLYVVYGSCVLH